jgi:TonB-linked SusC/RagA family outer membrane protein
MKDMILNKILYRYSRSFAIMLLSALMTVVLSGQEQKAKKTPLASLTVKVVDENGTAIPKARVVVGEGVIYTETDAGGSVTFRAYPEDFVSVSLSGYEKAVTIAEELIKNSAITLKKSKLFMTTDDDVPLPFLTLKKRNITGSSNILTSNQLEKYPSNDLRNSFTGLIPGLEVIERDGQPGYSSEENLGVYGITEKIGVGGRGRSLVYIIDDMPIDITQVSLDASEIESVTVIKDIAAKTMFGPSAADGIVYIKTKRGRSNERILNVNVESGVSVIDRNPGWVSGADYLRLLNTAKQNDGLTTGIYTDSQIDAYASSDGYNRRTPNNNYEGMMVGNSKSYNRANISSTGGNDVVQYYSYLGYSGEGDIYKMGPTSDYNRINTRSNVDIRLNDLIKAQFSIYGGLTFRRSPNYSGAASEGALSNLIDYNSVLNDITTIPPTALPVYAAYDTLKGIPWYGVTQSYPNNPIGNINGRGYYTESNRSGMTSVSLDYDMKNILSGLKFRTYVGFNALNLVRVGKANNYIAYIATPSTSVKTGNDTILLAKAHDGLSASDESNLHDYYSQLFTVYENLNYSRISGDHNLQASLTYYLSKNTENGIRESKRIQSGILTACYSYRDKYILQGVLNYSGTYSLPKGKRYSLFPSGGIGWVLSEEGFMSDLRFVNYLKIRAEGGILGYEAYTDPFSQNDRWNSDASGVAFGPYSANQWFGSAQETGVYRISQARVGNEDISWEKRKEISAGIDALMLGNRLSFEITYYNNLREGQLTRVSNITPLVAGISGVEPLYNYNTTRYFGFETGLRFTDHKGDFTYSVGANATVQNSKLVKYDEADYRFDYQRHTGTAADTYWGLTYLSKFSTDAEALVVPQIFDAVLKAGDLKYKDMNGDGIIDDNDQGAIGHTAPRLFYSLNLQLSYKNFDLTVIGTGRALYDLPQTNRYYWNGWGDNRYSDFVKDNVGGSYPRLTYYKVNNNFLASDFWLTKGGYFKIQNVEVAYNLPASSLQVLRTKGVRFFIRGANLLTISKVKEVDPESVNSGVTVYPLFRTFTGGIKLTF